MLAICGSIIFRLVYAEVAQRKEANALGALQYGFESLPRYQAGVGCWAPEITTRWGGLENLVNITEASNISNPKNKECGVAVARPVRWPPIEGNLRTAAGRCGLVPTDVMCGKGEKHTLTTTSL